MSGMQQLERTTLKVEGQCHCGSITYEAEVTPGTVGLCHCLDCQTLTGSAFRAQIPALGDTFRILTGMPKRYVKTADSGAKRVHSFCDNCGAPVYSCAAIDNPPYYSLRVGALKQRNDIGAPYRQIWTERRLSWVTRITEIPEMDAKEKS
jgi:hypothetical protein